MALIKCSECGKEISDKANACPNCGAPVFQDSVPNPTQQIKADAITQSGNTSTWGIASIVLGGASVVMPYFASVFLVPAAFISGVISYRKESKKLGKIGMILSFLGLCWIIYVSAQMNAIMKDPFGNHGILSSTSSKTQVITLDKFNNIKDGMAYWQVVSIIGKDGEKLSESEFSGFTTVMYSWSNSNGSSMNIMFQNGKLVSKAQFGLK